MKITLLKTAEEIFWTKRKNVYKETWSWEDSISKGMGEERHVWKAWNKGKASTEKYLVVKRGSKHAKLQKKLQKKRSFSASGSVIIEFSKYLSKW